MISSDYIPVDKIPLTKSGNTLANTNTTYPKAAPLTNAVSDSAYATGSAAIDASNPARKWLASYLNKYSSTGSNMKAVAYMMDTSVWNIFKGEKAEYVLGGPTVEMLIASYSKKHSVDYRARAKSTTGYEISSDGGENWANNYNGMLSTSDPLYVINSDSNAAAYWMASPSATGINILLDVAYSGNANNHYYNYNIIGFRPVVCLKSGVSLIANDDGSVTLV